MLHAVIVGIDKYSDARVPSLNHARDDAEALAARLRDGIHPEDRRVTLLVDSEATARAIRAAIGEAIPNAATSQDDVVLLYFAGHGSPETARGPEEASRYLVTHDTEHGHVYSTGIDMENDVTTWFRRIAQPRLVLMVLDACFSGRAGGRTFEGPQLKRLRSASRSAPLRLSELRLGEGRAIMSACDDDEVAREAHALGHGVFTHEFLDALRPTNTEANTISVTSLYDRVRLRVLERTGGLQEPVLNGRIVGARLPLLPAVETRR